MRHFSFLPRIRLAHGWILLAILGVSAWFNLTNLDFPPGFHGDERSKVQFIQQGTQNFRHPILMLQLVRAVNLPLNLSTELDLAILGRALMAIGATATVLLSYLLARRTMRPGSAAAVAAAVAVAPTLVVHAHYLKEDTILTTLLMASMLCFFRFVERLDRQSALWLGIATGLAFSSHYKSILLAPLYLIAPLLGTPRRTRHFYLQLSLAGFVATVVFLAINWPILVDTETFLRGMLFEAEHATEGHDVPIRWTDYWLGFHLLLSLAPGIGGFATVVAIAGLLRAIACWKEAPLQDRWLVVYVLVFYFVPEISPLKPWPDFSRYMIPIVPPLIYFAWQGVEHTAMRVRNRLRPAWVFAGGAALLILVPVYMSVRLVAGLADDTRARAEAWIDSNRGTAVFEQYSGEFTSVRTAVELDPAKLRADGIDFLVTSSFMYDRFAMGAHLSNQHPEVYETHAGYMKLFGRPFVEFAPAYRTFAFSNPVIRVVDLREPGVGRSER